MFNCTRGHVSKPREKGALIATEVREILNKHFSVDEKDREHLHVEVPGFEVSKEERFCSKHVAAAPRTPIVVNTDRPVERRHYFIGKVVGRRFGES